MKGFLPLLLFLPILCADAEIMIGRSIASLVDASEAIGEYEVSSVAPLNSKGAVRVTAWLGAIYPVADEGPDRIAFDCEASSDATGSAVKEKDDFLIFFSKDEKLGLIPFYFIDLSRLPNPGKPMKGDCRYPALTTDFRILTTRKDIKDEVQLRIERRPRKLPGNVPVEIPIGTGAWKALYSGSTCFLEIPADLKPPNTKAIGTR